MPIPEMKHEGVELILLPEAIKKIGLFGREVANCHSIKTRLNGKVVCLLELNDGRFFEALQEKKHKKKTGEELCDSNWLLVKEIKFLTLSVKESFIRYLQDYYFSNDFYLMDYVAKRIRVARKKLSKCGGLYCDWKKLKEYTPLSAEISEKGRRYKIFNALEIVFSPSIPKNVVFFRNRVGYAFKALEERK